MTALLILLSIGFSLLLWLMYRRHHKQVMQARKNLFSDVEKLMTIKQSAQDRAGFPQLVGEFSDNTVALRLEVDNLTPRKLPIMWLHITLLRPANAQGSLDVLVRPQPSDVFSPGWNWPKTITPPKNWPQHARYSSQGKAPMLQSIDSDIRTIFADQHAKEILITPETIRLTYLVRQGDRGHYLLLRAADFDMQPLDSAEIAACIRQLQKLLLNLDGVQCDEAA
jgi:hypothetical protein